MSATALDQMTSLGEALPDAIPANLFRRLMHRPLALAATIFLALVILGAVLAPWIAPYNPNDGDFSHTLSGPTWSHLLGTDDFGRDILSRIMYGGRVTLVGAAIAVGVAMLLGVSVGLSAGYLGGKTDWAVSRITEIWLSIPSLLFLLVVLSIFGHNEVAAMVTFGVLASFSVMRVVRSATLARRNELFVDAARVLGVPSRQIIVRHILPRIIGVVIVQGALLAAGAILIETGLGFLGLGVPPPTATWGGLVETASRLILVQPWLLVPSGAIVSLTALAFGLLGDALRDVTTQAWLAPATTASERRDSRRPADTVRGTEAVLSGGSTERALLSVADLVIEIAPGRPVVDAISFDIRAGEAVGLVGESGCGKTMTAMAVFGLLPAGAQIKSGHCYFSGRDITQCTPEELRQIRGREIGFISQNAIASLDPAFTVRSQLGEVVHALQPELTRKERHERVLELLELVRLPDPRDVARRYPHELSGGMAQRVAIAAALAGKPKLLIADEPTTALDVSVQAEILDLLALLQEQTAMAMLLITHDWGVVARMCRRTVVMYAGQAVEEGQVLQIFDQPLHPYTEGLLQSNPQLGRAREPLAAIPGTVPPAGRWPSGCRFQPRCKYATADCQLAPIPLLEIDDRLSRCIHTARLQAKALTR